MARQARYRLKRVDARTDGSGQVRHQMTAIVSDDEFATETEVGAFAKDFIVSASDLEVVNDMPDATGPQRTAKGTAYKDLLAANINTGGTPLPKTWVLSNIVEFTENNDASVVEAARAVVFIQLIKPTFPAAPIDFT